MSGAPAAGPSTEALRLFEPGRIGEMSLRNRLVMAPMGIGSLAEADGRVGPRAIAFYRARARGGVGLVITGATRVTRDFEYLPEAAGYLGIEGSAYVGPLSELADAVHAEGARLAVQLTAGRGRVSPLEYVRRLGAVAPSAVSCFAAPDVLARPLTVEEIARLVESFRQAARRLRAAGVDAVELHAHNGYLLDQFQTALWNRRTDAYGGLLDGRLRLAVEVVRAIKDGAGARFPVIYRFGLVHYLPGGREVPEGLEIARRLEAEGVDAFHVDAGCHERRYWASPPSTQPPGCMLDLAAEVRRVVRVPVIAVGRLGYPDVAEAALSDGKADFIALGRALLADPEWPRKVREGRREEIRPCVACYDACLGRIQEGKYVTCALNPQTGMERELEVRPAPLPRSVLVVGGGPAGMEAARVASLRGHRVTLWERAKVLGGQLVPGSVPWFKRDYLTLVRFLSGQLERQGVVIEAGREATPEAVRAAAPDVLIVATGGRTAIPRVPGIDSPHVAMAADVLAGTRVAGRRVAVIGGGLVGCETALHLAEAEREVTVVEMLESVARDMFFASRLHLLELLRAAGVRILTDTRLLEVTEDGVTVAGRDGATAIAADTVVVAVGLEVDGAAVEALRASAPEVHLIGDCVEPRKVYQAVTEGFLVGRQV